jgi:hypothetical protein
VNTQKRSREEPVQEEDDDDQKDGGPPLKRVQTPTSSAASIHRPIFKTAAQARINYWSENGNWPTEEQLAEQMNTLEQCPFQNLISSAQQRLADASRKFELYK